MEKEKETEKALIEKAQSGSSEAMLAMLKKYEPLIKKLCAGANDREELADELTASFLEALKTFDPKRGVYFPLYIHRRLRAVRTKMIRQWIRQKETEELDEGTTPAVEETRPTLRDLMQGIHFTEEEKKYLEACLAGQNWQETCRTCGFNPSRLFQVRKAIIEKIRKKWYIHPRGK